MTSLEQLVVALDDGPWWPAGNEWVQVMGPIEDRQLIADADLDHLLGFVAPPRCSAIALTASGWARSMDLPPLIAQADQQRVRITCAVGRDGRVAGRMRWADGSHVDEPPSSGRSLDILRRCLGLPTDPPAVPSAQLLAAQWLASVTRIARLRGRPLPWEEVAAQHPAMLLAGQGGLLFGAADLVPVAREAARLWTWTELLRQAGRPGPLADALPPGTGGWMDEGMFSRWLLAPYPPPETQVAEMAALMGPGTRRRVERALQRMGVPVGPPTASLDPLGEDGLELGGQMVTDGQRGRRPWRRSVADVEGPGRADDGKVVDHAAVRRHGLGPDA